MGFGLAPFYTVRFAKGTSSYLGWREKSQGSEHRLYVQEAKLGFLASCGLQSTSRSTTTQSLLRPLSIAQGEGEKKILLCNELESGFISMTILREANIQGELPIGKISGLV